MHQQRRSHIVCSPASPTDTDDADEAEYYRRAQARFRFYKKIEERRSDSEKPADAPSADGTSKNAPVNSASPANAAPVDRKEAIVVLPLSLALQIAAKAGA